MRTTNNYLKYCLLCCLALVFSSQRIAAERLTMMIAVSPNIQDVYERWTQAKDCWQVDDYASLHSSRGALELILLCKALHQSGLTFAIEFYPSPNYTRSLYLADSGKVHMPGETIWLDEIDATKYFITDAVIDVGEMKKGIFTIPLHPMQTSVNKAEQLKDYIGVIPKRWKQDWAVLSQLTPLHLNAQSSGAIHRMLEKGRADFTLGEFNKQMAISLEGVRLVPVKNLFVSLPQSRHFAIRKELANSDVFIAAINTGLARLKQAGEVEQMYKKAGFYPAQIHNWIDVSKPQ